MISAEKIQIKSGFGYPFNITNHFGAESDMFCHTSHDGVDRFWTTPYHQCKNANVITRYILKEIKLTTFLMAKPIYHSKCEGAFTFYYIDASVFIFILSFIIKCCLHCISVIVECEDASASNTTLSVPNFQPGPQVHSSLNIVQFLSRNRWIN